MQVTVVTPDASYYDGTAEAVYIPAWDGQMGILSKHAPMIARLGHGVARVIDGKDTTRVAIYGGFLKVQDDQVTVLAGGAASPTGDLAAAEKALDAARAELQAVKEAGKAQADVEAARETFLRAQAFRNLMQGT